MELETTHELLSLFPVMPEPQTHLVARQQTNMYQAEEGKVLLYYLWIEKLSSACLPAAPSSEEEDVFDMNEVSERRDRIYTLVLSADEFLAVRNLHLFRAHNELGG